MKRRYMLFIVFFAAAAAVFAQERGRKQMPESEFFIAPLAEANLNSRDSAAYGGGLMFGYGVDGAAIGIRVVYSMSDDLCTLEPAIFLRVYVPDIKGNSGLFVQAETGPALFGKNSLSEEVNAASAGLAAGWRFLPGDRVFLEGALRAGYPFIAGARLCLGIRF